MQSIVLVSTVHWQGKGMECPGREGYEISRYGVGMGMVKFRRRSDHVDANAQIINERLFQVPNVDTRLVSTNGGLNSYSVFSVQLLRGDIE